MDSLRFSAEHLLRDRPICIFAVARSGTHSLRQLLNLHPQVHIAAYSELLGVVLRDLPIESVEQILAWEESYTKRTKEHFLGVMREFILNFWMTTDKLDAARSQALRRWGFMAYNLPSWLVLRRLFPEGKIIHLVRDGRDVVASWLATWDTVLNVPGLGGPQTTVDGEPRRVKCTPVDMARHWAYCVNAFADGADLTVRLEDLIDDKQRTRTLFELCSSIGLEEAPELTSLADMPWVNYQKRALHRHRDDLTPADLKAIMAIPEFATAMQRFGFVS